jgi:transposase
MQAPVTSASSTPTETTPRSAPELEALVGQLTHEVTQLRRQVAWFQRQIFGQKSERRLPVAEGIQGSLGESFDAIADVVPENKKTRVAAHERQHQPKHPSAATDESALFFDEKKVPIEVINVPNAEAEGLTPDAYEIIGEKVSHRLAQRPGSYVVLKYVRPVIKRRDTQVLSCPAAPVGVIEGSRADVSFIVGMIVDKFAYHLPLYRLHLRLRDAGFKVSRHWLTQLMQQAVALLEPIHQAQLESIRAGRVRAMDETPIKAGPSGTGKMKAAYFWPVYGERDEICFLYYPSRSAQHVQDALGLDPPDGAVLLSDGYSAYKQYAKKTGLTHAQCWAHCRRHYYEAQDVEPERAAEALEMIGALYAIEARIRDQTLSGEAKRSVRLIEAQPVAQRFFAWVDKQFEGQGFLPSSPLTRALAYTRERREGLAVYLNDPDVPIDTNHLERALRVIPMGRKNWMFTWTELGAKHVGIVQSLLVTCRLHDINPYDYFVDVLQRVGQHPASNVEQLTPRRWKELFAHQPLRSDLYDLTAHRNHAAG